MTMTTTIAVGDSLPDVTFRTMTSKGPAERSTGEVFAGKTVALFAVPGAFTPTCHQKHLPGFLDNFKRFVAKGVDTIACTAVNDAFVLDAWSKDTGAGDRIVMLADGSGDFAKAIGMDVDLSPVGLGLRTRRYAMLVRDGVVAILNIEEKPSSAEASGAEALLRDM